MVKRRKLRNYWLIPSYQGRYVGFLVVACLIVMAGYGLVFYSFISENYETIVELAPMEESAQANLYKELRTIIIYLCSLSALFLAAITFIGVVFSHKVAGPMFKIKTVCNAINNGQFGRRIALRPGDDFREVVADLNRALNTLHVVHSKVFKVTQSETLLNEVFAVERLAALVDEKKLSATALVKNVDAPDEGAVPVMNVIVDYQQAGKPA
jgi:methyl-accepting chemotaxis protein